MVDIRLITILQPPQQAQGITPGQQVQGVVQPQVTQGGVLPNILANLPTGSVLSGYIINRDPSGNPVLRTETADILFSSNFFLKIGSEVTIRVENRAGQQQARILTVNGQPPEVAQNQSAFARDPEVIVGQGNQHPHRTAAPPGQDTIIARVPTGTVVTGTLLPPATAQPQATPQALPLPAGTQLVLKIVTLTPPPQQPVTTATVPPAPTAAATPPASTIPTAATQAAASPQAPQTATPVVPGNANNAAAANPAAQPIATQAPPPGYASYVRTDAATPGAPAAATPATGNAQAAAPAAPAAQQPATPAATLPLPNTGGQIVATVLGKEPAGNALLETPYGHIRLNPGTIPLPPGAKVTFELTQLVAPTSLASLPPAPLAELAHEWASLKTIFGLLAGQAGTTLPSLLSLPALLTPNSNPAQPLPMSHNMTAGVLIFIAALRGGDFRNWLGKDNTEWLIRNGHEQLLRRAEGEFITLSRPYAEPVSQHWQALLFPFLAGGEVQMGRLFVKRDRKQGREDQKGEEDDSRFVLEVELSQLGAIQMDGFVRHRKERTTEFDLIIRSHIALSPEMQDEILRIYNNTGELTGYAGSLQFATVEEFPVSPLEEIDSGSHGVLIV